MQCKESYDTHKTNQTSIRTVPVDSACWRGYELLLGVYTFNPSWTSRCDSCMENSIQQLICLLYMCGFVYISSFNDWYNHSLLLHSAMHSLDGWTLTCSKVYHYNTKRNKQETQHIYTYIYIYIGVVVESCNGLHGKSLRAYTFHGFVLVILDIHWMVLACIYSCRSPLVLADLYWWP